MKKKYIFVGIAIIIIGSLIYLWSQRPQVGEIPTEHQALYAELEQKLDDFDRQLEAQRVRGKYSVIFGADLLVANANRGPNLLVEENYQWILLYLDRLQELGIQGVKITIGYPLLVSGFPRSSEYLAFYTKLAKEIKEKRKMKLLVQATALFTQAEFSDLGSTIEKYYQDLTLEKYQQGKREQMKKIIAHIQPDYLTVETEPDTMARNTGLKKLNDPKTFKAVVEYQIKDLKRGNTLVGAGVGTWNDRQFVEELVKLPDLDFLELRIYPIVSDYLQRAIDYIDMAKSYNKKVVFGESWLYKTSSKEIASGEGAAWAKIFARDTFSFWQPLDEKFLEIFVKLAHYKQIEFISPFWTTYFFGYLDYGLRTKYRSSGTLLKLAGKKAIKNLASGEFSQTGLKYKELITE